MSKSKDKKPAYNNLVAKHAGKFCKAQTHRDKTKYFRKEKHKKGPSGPFYLAMHKYFIWQAFILRAIAPAMHGGL